MVQQQINDHIEYQTALSSEHQRYVVTAALPNVPVEFELCVSGSLGTTT